MSYDDRSLKETMQDADAKLRTANALNLAQLGLQGAQVRLQADALNEQRETNRRLEELGVTQAQLVDLGQELNGMIAEGNRTVNRMADETHRISNQIERHGEAIENGINRMRYEHAVQSFSMWRQTPEGVRYTQWRDEARRIANGIVDCTRRMNEARATDLRDLSDRLLSDRLRKYGPAPQHPVEPEPLAEKDPGEFDIPKPTKEYGKIRTYLNYAILIGCIILVCKIGYGLPIQVESPGMPWVVIIGLVVLALFILVGLVLGGIVMTIVDAVLDAIFPRTKREYERNLAAYEESKRTYEKTKQRYDEESKRYAEAMQAYRIRMNAWNHDMTQWNANVDLQGLTSQVRESIPDADSWSTEDSSSMLEGLLSIMENAIYTRPEPDSLPHLMFPALRDPSQFPECAPHMRAAMASICADYGRAPQEF